MVRILAGVVLLFVLGLILFAMSRGKVADSTKPKAEPTVKNGGGTIESACALDVTSNLAGLG